MNSTPQATIDAHLDSIVAAIEELLRISRRGAAPASMPSQYIGTIIDNTTALLTAPANALDQGNRHVTFSEPANWLSLMQALHRSFFASILIAVEAGLAYVCAERQLVVDSEARRRAERLATRIEEKVGSSLVVGELRELRRLGNAQPAFGDYLDRVLAASAAAPGRRRIWRRFFRALSIVRNKASHSETALTAQERADLIAGGFATMVDPAGKLQLNPRMYTQVAGFCFDFWDEILREAQ